MKTYNNGPRKSMMYGGMSRRKPMMYGGKATTKKPRKKAYMGGMMSATQPQQNMMQNNMTSGQMNQMQTQMMQAPKLRMSKGGEAFGMLSVKAGIDNNPKPTQADRIAGATKKKR
jgi:hypothetical protein